MGINLTVLFFKKNYLCHCCVDSLELFQGKVVREPDQVVVPLQHLGLVNPDTGGDTGLL